MKHGRTREDETVAWISLFEAEGRDGREHILLQREVKEMIPFEV